MGASVHAIVNHVVDPLGTSTHPLKLLLTRVRSAQGGAHTSGSPSKIRVCMCWDQLSHRLLQQAFSTTPCPRSTGHLRCALPSSEYGRMGCLAPKCSSTTDRCLCHSSHSFMWHLPVKRSHTPAGVWCLRHHTCVWFVIQVGVHRS